VGFDVHTAANMKMWAFWDILLCSLIGVDPRFRGAYCLQHQGWWWRQYAPLKRQSTPTRLHGTIPQKVLIFILYNVFQTCSTSGSQLTWFTMVPSVQCCTQTSVSCYQINTCSIIGTWPVKTVIFIHFTIPSFKSIRTFTAENKELLAWYHH
jgi:hypothetical protein